MESNTQPQILLLKQYHIATFYQNILAHNIHLINNLTLQVLTFIRRVLHKSFSFHMVPNNDPIQEIIKISFNTRFTNILDG